MTLAEMNEHIYQAYPRHVGKRIALEKIDLAAKRIEKAKGLSPIEARRWLCRVVMVYARSPAGSNPDRMRIPHPSTWFYQDRFYDDPSEWQHGGFTHGRLTATQQRTVSAHDTLQELVRRGGEGVGTGELRPDRPRPDSKPRLASGYGGVRGGA